MAARDDFFTLIHKALRAGMFTAALEAGQLDWQDRVQVEAFKGRWDTLVELLRSHARHEDDYMWPLLEAKRPGAVVELGIGHEVVEADVGVMDAELAEVLRNPSLETGTTFYRALNRFVAHSLNHFANEEPAVMEMLWALCSDDELAACRAGFMAEISAEERAATLELILQSSTTAEQTAVLRAMRAGLPAGVFASWLAEMEHVLSEPAFRKLTDIVSAGAASSS